jgi:hypothetical protein
MATIFSDLSAPRESACGQRFLDFTIASDVNDHSAYFQFTPSGKPLSMRKLRRKPGKLCPACVLRLRRGEVGNLFDFIHVSNGYLLILPSKILRCPADRFLQCGLKFLHGVDHQSFGMEAGNLSGG